jgi:hypothetical protein
MRDRLVTRHREVSRVDRSLVGHMIGVLVAC